MAENQDTPAAETKKSGGMASMLIWVVLALASVGAGFATPMLLFKSPAASEEKSKANGAESSENLPPALIAFDEVIVNLNESRLNRYLRLKIAVLVNSSDEKLTKEQLEKKRGILKSWLLSFLADKALDDIRGATGQNRIRREIQNHFNSVLFSDGIQRIRNVLFEEFNIQ